MKVLKFGGTSVGSPDRMKSVAQLITDGQQKIVVFSAMSGTTNSLIEIADYFTRKNTEAANNIINQLQRKYESHILELYTDPNSIEKSRTLLNEIFDLLRSFSNKEVGDSEYKFIIAQGEIISTNLITNYLLEKGVKALLISALDYMKLDCNDEPDMDYIKDNITQILKNNPDYELYITQGFICRDCKGEVSNLQRGGSDYTACLIGAVLKSEEIQIWTDIDGMHNNDPRVVDNTAPVRQLNFEEAAELAYFGAKILHPTCIQPARYAGVPVKLLNTMDPSAPGTIINNKIEKGCIKAVAAKDNITAIKIVSSRMLLATGFLRKVFEIFETYKTPVDMVTTSEVGVSLSIDSTAHLVQILDELKKYGTVLVDHDMCIVCVVGDLQWGNVGFESLVTSALEKIPVRMISYGGSDHNISFLIRKQDKKELLQALSNKLFN